MSNIVMRCPQGRLPIKFEKNNNNRPYRMMTVHLLSLLICSSAFMATLRSIARNAAYGLEPTTGWFLLSWRLIILGVFTATSYSYVTGIPIYFPIIGFGAFYLLPLAIIPAKVFGAIYGFFRASPHQAA